MMEGPSTDTFVFLLQQGFAFIVLLLVLIIYVVIVGTVLLLIGAFLLGLFLMVIQLFSDVCLLVHERGKYIKNKNLLLEQRVGSLNTVEIM